MPEVGQVLGMLLLVAVGVAFGWFWQRARARRREASRQPSIASQLSELRAVGELSVFKAVSKDLLTQVDHSFGEFGRKYLSWAFTRKKLAMIFEFEMDFRYNLRSDFLRIDTEVMTPHGGRRAVIHLPPCRIDVAIKDLAFYDEQRARFLPWLLPDLIQGVFEGRFSEEDKNRLIASAKGHAMAQAQSLAQRYRQQVEQSAYATLRLILRPLGFTEIEVRFQEQSEVSGNIEFSPSTQVAEAA